MKTTTSYDRSRIKTRVLAQLGINSRLQAKIRQGSHAPVRVGSRVYTYCSAGFFVSFTAAYWAACGCNAVTLAA